MNELSAEQKLKLESVISEAVALRKRRLCNLNDYIRLKKELHENGIYGHEYELVQALRV